MTIAHGHHVAGVFSDSIFCSLKLNCNPFSLYKTRIFTDFPYSRIFYAVFRPLFSLYFSWKHKKLWCFQGVLNENNLPDKKSTCELLQNCDCWQPLITDLPINLWSWEDSITIPSRWSKVNPYFVSAISATVNSPDVINILANVSNIISGTSNLITNTWLPEKAKAVPQRYFLKRFSL